MDDRSIARLRMHNLGLIGPPFPSPTAVVRGLLAVQAENYAQAAWAVACRTQGTTAAEFQTLFDEGAILRTHIIRPTWHFVLPDDIRWLTEVTAPRIRRSFLAQQRHLGIDDAVVAPSLQVITDALSQGVHLTRAALGGRLRAAGLPAEGQPLGLLLMTAELSGLICSGATQGKEQTFPLLDERAPHARRLDREEALAELTLRYLTSHGPATERDLSYWASLSLTDVRVGIAANAAALHSFEHGGRTYLLTTPPFEPQRIQPRAHLLQILDEYYRGYQESRYVLDTAGLAPRGRETSIGMTLVDGQMAGDMRRTVRGGTATFEVNSFRSLTVAELDAVCAAGARYGEFLGLPASVVVDNATVTTSGRAGSAATVPAALPGRGR